MKVVMIPVGQLQSNCYLAYDDATRDALIIDPGDEPERILEAVQRLGLAVKALICTHAHFDHAGAVAKLKQATNAPVLLHEDDLPVNAKVGQQGSAWGFHVVQPPPPDRLLQEGDEVAAGNVRLTVLHTPGHSPGSICLLGEGVLFTGDTVFAGSVGRTDFPGGSYESLRRSFKRIMELSPEIRIYPGHGSWTTVGQEREGNFFVQEIRGL